VATPRLRERIEQYDGSACFNLLALCKSPLVTLPTTIARAIKSLHVLDERMRSSGDPDWSNLIPSDTFKNGVPISFDGPDALASLGGLTAADIYAAEVLDDRLKCDAGAVEGMIPIGDAHALHEQIVYTLEGARSEYFVRESVVQDNAARVEGRKQNWMPAIHAWLKALAEKGVLQDLITESKE
jgi:ubiquitin carboxyl-terminal hydrolase L5